MSQTQCLPPWEMSDSLWHRALLDSRWLGFFKRLSSQAAVVNDAAVKGWFDAVESARFCRWKWKLWFGDAWRLLLSCASFEPWPVAQSFIFRCFSPEASSLPRAHGFIWTPLRALLLFAVCVCGSLSSPSRYRRLLIADLSSFSNRVSGRKGDI